MESRQYNFLVSFLCKNLQLLGWGFVCVLFAMTKHSLKYKDSSVLSMILFSLLLLLFGWFVWFFGNKQWTHTVFFHFFDVQKLLIYELRFFRFDGFYIKSIMRRCFSGIFSMNLSNFLSFLDVLFHVFEHLLAEIWCILSWDVKAGSSLTFFGTYYLFFLLLLRSLYLFVIVLKS